eukprot:gene2460-7776_t
MSKPTPGETTVVVGDKKAGNNRSIGVLLGSWQGKLLDVANSFAVPFEEDPTNPEVASERVYECVCVSVVRSCPWKEHIPLAKQKSTSKNGEAF